MQLPAKTAGAREKQTASRVPDRVRPRKSRTIPQLQNTAELPPPPRSPARPHGTRCAPSRSRILLDPPHGDRRSAPSSSARTTTERAEYRSRFLGQNYTVSSKMRFTIVTPLALRFWPPSGTARTGRQVDRAAMTLTQIAPTQVSGPVQLSPVSSPPKDIRLFSESLRRRTRSQLR
jgi:hypothetical protein